MLKRSLLSLCAASVGGGNSGGAPPVDPTTVAPLAKAAESMKNYKFGAGWNEQSAKDLGLTAEKIAEKKRKLEEMTKRLQAEGNSARSKKPEAENASTSSSVPSSQKKDSQPKIATPGDHKAEDMEAQLRSLGLSFGEEEKPTSSNDSASSSSGTATSKPSASSYSSPSATMQAAPSSKPGSAPASAQPDADFTSQFKTKRKPENSGVVAQEQSTMMRKDERSFSVVSSSQSEGLATASGKKLSPLDKALARSERPKTMKVTATKPEEPKKAEKTPEAASSFGFGGPKEAVAKSSTGSVFGGSSAAPSSGEKSSTGNVEVNTNQLTKSEIGDFLEEIKKTNGEREFSAQEVEELVGLLKNQRITTMEQLKKLSQEEIARCGILVGAANIIYAKLQKQIRALSSAIPTINPAKVFPNPATISKDDAVIFEECPPNARWLFGNEHLKESFRIIRPFYSHLLWSKWKALIEGAGRATSNTLLIYGHPGIGKSLSLDVLLAFTRHTFKDTALLCMRETDFIFCPPSSSADSPYTLKKDEVHDFFLDETTKLRDGPSPPPLLFFGDMIEKTAVIPDGLIEYSSDRLQVGASPVLRVLAYSYYHTLRHPAKDEIKRMNNQTFAPPLLEKHEAEAWYARTVLDYLLKDEGKLPPAEQKKIEQTRDQFVLDNFEDIFQVSGGVPRRLLPSPTGLEVRQFLIDKKNEVEQAAGEIKLRSHLTTYSESTSKITTPIPVDDYHTFGIQPGFVSVVAKDAFFRLASQTELENMWTEAERNLEMGKHANGGNVFEDCVGAVLKKGGCRDVELEPLSPTQWPAGLAATSTFRKLRLVRELSDGKVQSAPRLLSFSGTGWKGVKDEYDRNQAATPPTTTLCTPLVGNFPVTDFIIINRCSQSATVTLVQSTLSANHSPTTDQMKMLLETFPSPIKFELIWIGTNKHGVSSSQELVIPKNTNLNTSQGEAVKKEFSSRVKQFKCSLTRDSFLLSVRSSNES